MLGLLLIILSAIVFPGVILRLKSIASGRKGPGLFQPMKDIWVLLRKGSVFSRTTSFVFQWAPSISLAAVLTAMLVLPFGKFGALISFSADFVFFSYLLAMAKFLSIASAMDTGSAFEGMGANREALYSMLVEPAFFVLMGTFAMLTGYTSFSEIFSNFLITGNHFTIIFGIIGLYLLIQIMMIECSRLPIDDPKTHLELTMVHEVMILDNSGFDKALIHMASYLKFAIYGSLIFSSIVPTNWALGLQIALFFGLQFTLAACIGLLESFRARNKMMRNQQFILTLTAIALMAFVVVLILTQNLVI